MRLLLLETPIYSGFIGIVDPGNFNSNFIKIVYLRDLQKKFEYVTSELGFEPVKISNLKIDDFKQFLMIYKFF